MNLYDELGYERYRHRHPEQAGEERRPGLVERAARWLATPPLQPSSWGAAQQAGDAGYRVDTRIRNAGVIAQHAVDAVVDTHDYINARSEGRHPALVAELRQIEATVGGCSALLLARYLGGR